MKKIIMLVGKCLLVSFPLWFLAFLLSRYQMYYVSTEMACLDLNKSITSTHQDKYYKAIVLGDSTANAAFMPEVISDSMINLSMLGTGPIEGYYTLKEYLENNKAPEACYVCYYDSHYHLLGVYWDEIVAGHRFNVGTNLDIIKNATEETSDKGLFAALSDFVAYQLYFPSKYTTTVLAAVADRKEGISRFDKNEATLAQAKLHNGRYAYIGNQIFETVQMREYPEMAGKQIYIDYMCKIIELCQANNIEVYLEKAPMPDNAILTEQYISDVNSFYSYFTERYDNVSFDWDDKIYESKYFAEESHLNNDGAYRFSTHIKECNKKLFGEEGYSPEQMASLDDTIAMENRPEDLFLFIDQKDYSIFIYDNDADVDRLVTQFGDNKYKLTKASDELPIYRYSKNDETSDYEITSDSNSVTFKIAGADDYTRWTFPERMGVSLLVVDNVNNKAVTIKNIEYYGEDGYSQWVY